ncbi:MAG: 3'(2'),5'-bisphosphate nucleotidase CysQ [Castellaniella sp.]|uniref:3'(2'),5'-bisphosphate nucleotidase CysQ family protein n=1 Tax=Castellaniella sp. TaxID=1955812 RepID=UPI003C70D84F
MHELLDYAATVARRAGTEILKYYHLSSTVNLKHDGSPLTIADQKSHALISDLLAQTGIDIVSEEGGDLKLDSYRYWLVDPLDGTKDFLAKNDQFTVNIALIEANRPVLGVVFAPASNEMYAGGISLGATYTNTRETAVCAPLPANATCRMTVSRFHAPPDNATFAQHNAIASEVAVGSALKYGYLATGQADVYPRLIGSSEWDTAAGQAVLEAVGGAVLDWHRKEPLRYGKARRRNPRLIAFRAPYTIDQFTLQDYPEKLL